MNKSVYLALIGATAAQKTPFAKHREAHLHKRKLQDFDMEGMDWGVAALEESEPMEYQHPTLYLTYEGIGPSYYWSMSPMYTLYSDPIDTTTEPASASYMLEIMDNWSGMYQICYLTANLDSNLAPSQGFTVVD